MILEWILRK